MRDFNRLLASALIALICLGLPAVATAQPDNVSIAGLQSPPPSWQFTLHSLGAGSPIGWFIGFGLQHPPSSYDWSRGRFLVAEVGAGGTRVSAGVGGATYAGGSQLRLSVIRTYGDPWRVPANRTLVGPELRVSANMLTVGVAVYSLQGAQRNEDRVLLALMGGFTWYLD